MKHYWLFLLIITLIQCNRYPPMNTPDTVNNKLEFVKKYEGFTIIETDIFAKEYFLFVKKGRVQMKVTVPKKVFENYRKRDIIKKDVILK